MYDNTFFAISKPLTFTKGSQMSDDNKPEDKNLQNKLNNNYLPHIVKLSASVDKAFDQLQDMDSLIAKTLNLSESQTSKFEQIKNAYSQFVKADAKSQNQKLSKVLDCFQRYCESLDKQPHAHPPFSNDLTYYHIAKIVFDTRVQTLKNFLRERNLLLFQNPTLNKAKRK